MTFSQVLSGWLKVWNRIYQRSPLDVVDEAAKREVVAAYAGMLSDLTAEQLDAACRLAGRSCKFFPTPADIMEHVQKADKAGAELEAETAWHQALEYARRWYVPDFGLDRRAPELPPATEQAIRAAGGFRLLESCSESDLVWARKRFLESFGRIGELERSGLMLTRGEAKRVLAQLATGTDTPKALPSATIEADRGASGLQVLRDVFAEVLGREQPEAVTR